jgi:hypothetical protein
MQDGRFDVSLRDNIAIRKAACKGHSKVVELLLLDSRVDPSASNNSAIVEASRGGHVEVVRLLLQDARVDPQDSKALCGAIQNERVGVVEILLKDPRIDPTEPGNKSIEYAASARNVEVINLLLRHPSIDPARVAHIIMDKFLFLYIYEEKFVKEWVQDERITVDLKTKFLDKACVLGYAKVCEAILEDIRVNPAANDSKTLRVASQCGHLAVVDILLQDPRVVRYSLNNECIRDSLATLAE